MSDHDAVARWLMHLGDGDDGNMWNYAEDVQDAYNDLRAENERLRECLALAEIDVSILGDVCKELRPDE